MPIEKEQKPDNRWFILLWAVIATFIIVLILSLTWLAIADKQYLGSLTPEERQEIAEQERIEQLEREKRQEESSKFLVDIFYFPVPLIFVLISITCAWYYTSRRRW